MTILTEEAAEQLIAARAFATAPPGFVGAAVDVPAPGVRGRHPLRHGFLKAGSPQIPVVSGPPSPGPGVVSGPPSPGLAVVSGPPSPGLAVVSGPPSPGLAVCLARMTDDLRAARPLIAPPGDRFSPEAGIRVGLEAGLEGGGVLGLSRRWRLAHRLAPVLAAAFANAPAAGRRSIRQASRKNLPVVPPGDPRQAWLAYAMSTPTPGGVSLRDRFRAGDAPTVAELADHLDALRPPVAARGHLELDVADAQPGDGWRLPIVLAATLLDDPHAAEQAETATAHLESEPGLWERAARDALTDPVLAAAARDCFLAAYAALARQGAARSLRDALAEHIERYVLRARTPADDILDHLTARP